MEPTRDSIHSSIYTLNDDVLLNIFHLYQLDIGDEGVDGVGLIIRNWDRQRWWYKLARVCRRWRYLMLESRSQLDLHLVCTYGVPVADMIAHSPSLPLTISYGDRGREMTAEDEEGALIALSHRDRVSRIALWMPGPKLGKFIMTLEDQFPILDRFTIVSLTEEESSLKLPQTFQAPNLRHVDMWYTALPIRSPLLTPTGNLAYLWLAGIPRSAYFPPSYLLTRLSGMPQLETLGIIFHSPLPSRDVVRQLSDTPIMNHITLPNLRLFAFGGVNTYLEGLLSRMSAPVLGVLLVFLSNQLTLTLSHLLQFVQTSQNLGFTSVELAFDTNAVTLIADPHRGLWKCPLYLQIMCRHLDWQVVSAVQILGTFSPLLSVVEKLTLNHVEHNRSSEWHNEVDRTQWRELLRPFSNVKVLHLQNELVLEFSRSLHMEGDEMPLELLPSLEELSHSGPDVDGAFNRFIDERQTAGHPVRLVSRQWRSVKGRGGDAESGLTDFDTRNMTYMTSLYLFDSYTCACPIRSLM
jgi:hypothetical protein